MALTNAAGTPLTKAALVALTTVVTPPVVRKLTAPIYHTYTHPGAGNFEGERTLKYNIGDEVPQAEIDRLFADSAATISTLSPVTGAAAGGTVVTINGSRFGGATAVKFGAATGTEFKRVSDTKITVKTPAGTAGAVTVTVVDDGGDTTKANGFSYTA